MKKNNLIKKFLLIINIIILPAGSVFAIDGSSDSLGSAGSSAGFSYDNSTSSWYLGNREELVIRSYKENKFKNDATIVAFGDSYANGPNYSLYNQCEKKMNTAISRLSGKMYGKALEKNDAVADYSCSGETLKSLPTSHTTFSMEVDAALRFNSLSEATEAVFFNGGGNEQFGSRDTFAYSLGYCSVFNRGLGCSKNPTFAKASKITGKYLAGVIRREVLRIKYAAPYAKIFYYGYPTIFEDRACVPVAGLGGPKIEKKYLVDLLNSLEQAQKDAAKILGIKFISLKKVTAKHGICQPNNKRWLTQLGDFVNLEEMLPGHPNNAGYEAQAKLFISELRKINL